MRRIILQNKYELQILIVLDFRLLLVQFQKNLVNLALCKIHKLLFCRLIQIS
jgi:hypothetical protein